MQGSFSSRVSLLGAPQEEKQRVVDGGGCLLCSSLFGSAGHVPSLRGILPELLRSFQAGERSRLWCALPNSPDFSCRRHCLKVKSRENSSPTVAAPHASLLYLLLVWPPVSFTCQGSCFLLATPDHRMLGPAALLFKSPTSSCTAPS